MALVAAPVAAMFAELFNTAVRYSAVSLAYQIAAIFGGALAPHHRNRSVRQVPQQSLGLGLRCLCLRRITCLCEHA
jgi:hypothetical protein